MCNSLRASIVSSITSTITCVILYFYPFHQSHQSHKVFQTLAIFFFFVSLMQYYDVIFWLNQKKNTTNFITTKLAMITNHLQPIVYAYLISKQFTISIYNKTLLFIYTAFAIFYSINAYKKIDYTLVTKQTSPVLFWEWNYLIESNSDGLYAIFLLVLILFSLELPYPFNWMMVILNTASYLFSRFTMKREVVGKYWCILASYAPLAFIIAELFNKF